ncbi:hypothetical protein [Populibacterium corticicola]
MAGPRGRRLLLEIACARNPKLEELMFSNLIEPLDSTGRARVVVEFARSTALLEKEPTTQLELLLALRESVDRAMYWQAPDAEDKLLAQPQVASALRPLAVAVSPYCPDWWVDAMAPGQQRVQPANSPSIEYQEAWQAGAGVRQWYSQAIADETAAQTYIPDPAANYTGMWWSTPAHYSVPATTRVLDGLGPVALWAQEDTQTPQYAVSYPISLIGPCRVLEITSAHDYARLVEKYPMRMTRSRFHDWYRVTGSVDEWYIPHWGLIAKDYEAVHLTTAAYLEGATKRIPISGGSTLMAGWSPDVTYWVGNCAVLGGRPEEWQLAAQGSNNLWLAA